MSKNRNRKHPPQSGGVLKARSEYGSRQLVKRYGGLENAHSHLHASAFEFDRKRKGIRTINIPAFQGWYFSEYERGFLIIPPKGVVAGHKVCSEPRFRGSEVSVLPTDTATESQAKGLIKLLIAIAHEQHTDPYRAITVTTSSELASSSSTVIVIAKQISKDASELSRKAHTIALAWCERFRFHLGVFDPVLQEKIVGLITKGYVPIIR